MKQMTLREAMRRLAVHLALATVAVTQPMLGLYGDNLAVFTTAKIDGAFVIAFGVMVVVAPALVVWAGDITLSLAWPRVSRMAHLVAVYVGFWAATAVTLRSVSVGPWQIDALLTALVALLVAYLYARWRAISTWVGWMSPLSVVVFAVFVASVAPVVWPPEPGRAAQGRGSAAHVVWIVLDEAPLYALMSSNGTINDDRFPGFGALAETSTWYRNAVSSSSRTIVSLASMLSSTDPDYSKQPILADHPDNIFTLVNGAMELDVVEEATALCAGAWCERSTGNTGGVPSTGVGRSVSFRSFVRDASVVFGHTVLPRELRASLPPIDEGWGGFGGAKRLAPAVSGEADGDQGDEDGSTLIGVRRGLAHIETVGRVVAAATRPTLGFAHLIIPHRPWVFAPDQRMSAMPIPDVRPPTSVDRRRDAYQSLLNQYLAVDAQIGRMLEILRSSPNWDRTMVVVTADHGITFVPGVGHRKTDPAQPGTFDDVFRVPLFVRYPGQDEGRIDDCDALSLDILPTVAAGVGQSPAWPMSGVDLYETCPQRPARDVSWLAGSAQMRSGVDELFSRVSWYGEWVDPDGNADEIYKIGPYGDLVGTQVPRGAPVDDSVEWYLNNADAFGAVSGERFGAVPTRAVGRMTPRRNLSESEEILVAVDGVFVGVVREAAGLKAGLRRYFSASLMSRLIEAGSHEVSLWIARPGVAGPIVSRLGPPSK